MELRPFQQDIETEIRRALSKGFMSPLVVSPTGSGKTVIFSDIAKGAMKKGNRVLTLVHREEILKQTLKKMFGFGIQCGQIASGRSMTNDMNQVAMVGALVRRLDKIKKPDLIIIDECHHAAANTWTKILDYFADVPKIGFTATPERADGAGLGHIFDTIIQGPQISQLVKDGFLSYPVLYKPEKEVTDKFHLRRGDFDKDEQVAVMTRKTIVGNVIEHYRQYLDKLPTVCFCVSLEHCRQMTAIFKDAGWKSEMVWGGMPENEREAAFKGLADGSIHIVNSCDLINEGVDVEILAGCIQLCRTTSLAKCMQQIGRTLRIYPGKTHATILDHAGNYYIHGHILQDREWSLDQEKRSKRTETPPTTTSCPKCNGVWPGEPRVCPGYTPLGGKCGFVFSGNDKVETQQRKTPEMIVGELVAALPPDTDQSLIDRLKMDAVKIQQMDAKTRQKYMLSLAYKSRNIKEIKALSKVVGYKDGWAGFVWKNILGNR